MQRMPHRSFVFEADDRHVVIDGQARLRVHRLPDFNGRFGFEMSGRTWNYRFEAQSEVVAVIFFERASGDRLKTTLYYDLELLLLDLPAIRSDVAR